MKSKYKIGDKVICVGHSIGQTIGGWGWENDKIFTIRKISLYNDKSGNVLWPEDKNACGIYEPHVRLYEIVPQEMFEL